jgi:hypothetical protein
VDAAFVLRPDCLWWTCQNLLKDYDRSRRGDLLHGHITDLGAPKRREIIVPAAIAQGDIDWDRS